MGRHRNCNKYYWEKLPLPWQPIGIGKLNNKTVIVRPLSLRVCMYVPVCADDDFRLEKYCVITAIGWSVFVWVQWNQRFFNMCHNAPVIEHKCEPLARTEHTQCRMPRQMCAVVGWWRFSKGDLKIDLFVRCDWDWLFQCWVVLDCCNITCIQLYCEEWKWWNGKWFLYCVGCACPCVCVYGMVGGQWTRTNKNTLIIRLHPIEYIVKSHLIWSHHNRIYSISFAGSIQNSGHGFRNNGLR